MLFRSIERLADEGGGRSLTSRRLAIAPPDASDRSPLLPTMAAGKQRRPRGSLERRPDVGVSIDAPMLLTEKGLA